MDELELSFIQQEVERLTLATPAPGKHAARNAVHHLRRAWRIRELDPEMAAFRSITAEEEAARALLHSLQRHRYPGAERLNWRNHTHKAAVIPFLIALTHAVSSMPDAEAQLALYSDDGVERLKFSVKLTTSEGVVGWLRSDPPLDFELTFDDMPYDFAGELERISTDVEAASIEDYVEKRANERNRILYATDQGIPAIASGTESVLRLRCANVFRVLTAYLLIDAYRQHQRFVVQCLSVFLDLVTRIGPRRGRKSTAKAT